MAPDAIRSNSNELVHFRFNVLDKHARLTGHANVMSKDVAESPGDVEPRVHPRSHIDFVLLITFANLDFTLVVVYSELL